MPDLSDFQATVEAGAQESGDAIATGIQEGVSKGAADLGSIEGQLSLFGEETGAKIGDGLAAGVESGVAKSAAALDALSADAAAAADKTAAAGAEASDSMSKGFLSGGMSKLLGGTLFAGISADLVEHLADAATKTAESLQVTEAMLGLTAQQAEHLDLIASAAGLSLSQLDKMAARLDKNLAAATGGSATQAKALDTLGVSAQKFAASNLDQKAALFATAVAKGNVPAKTLATTLKAFNIDPTALAGAKTYGSLLDVIKKGMQETATTGSTFARMLTQNGINVEKFAQEKFPDQLTTIATAFQNASSKAQGTALVMAAFGRQGVQLLPLIENMSSLNKLSDELHLPTLNTENTEKAGMEFNMLKQYVELVAEDLATKLVPIVVEVATKLVEVIGPIATAIAKSQALKQAFDDISTVLHALIDDISSVVSTVADFVSGSSTAQTVLEAVAAAVGGVAAAFVVWTAATAAWEAITEAATAVQAAFNAVMDANPIGLVVLAIAALVGALVVLYEKVPAVRDIINEAFADIKTVVSEAVDFLEGLWQRWGGEITADAETAWNDIKSIVSTAISVVSEVISTTVAVIEALWQRFGGTIMSVIQTAWNMIVTYVTTEINAVKDVISIVIDVIEGKWGDAWGKLKDLVSTVLTGIWTLIKDSASIALTVMEALGTAALHGILAGLSDLGSKIWTEIKKAFETVVAGDQWLVSEAEKIGEDIVRGMWQGVESLSGWIESKAKDFAHTLVGYFKDPLKILSPSQVMSDEVGVPIGQGIVAGIDKALGSGPSGTLGTKVAAKVKDATDAAKVALETGFASLQAKAAQLGPALGTAASQALQALHAAVSNAVTTTDVSNAHAAISKAGQQISADLAVVKKQIADAKVFDGLKADADKLGSDVTPEIAADMKKIQDEMSTVVTIQGQAKISEQVTALKTLISNELSKIKTTISNEQGAFSTAFQELVSPIDSDFEAATAKAIANMQTTVTGAFQSFQYGGSAGIITPAQAQLNTLQEAHDAAQQQAQLAADQAQLALDQQSADAATILSDQQAVAEDQYQIQVSALTKQADLENTAADTQLTAAQNSYQDQRTALETAMNQRLTDIETGLSNGNISAQQGMDDLDGILTDPQYGIDANQSAYALGGQVYTGLSAGLKPVFDMVTQLQDNLAKIGQLQASVSTGPGNTPPAISTSTPIFASENGDPGLALKQALNETVVPALTAQTAVIKSTAAQTTVTINSTTSHAAQTARDALR
jgi:phage-related protein